MIAYYADPYARRPFWREREDDGRQWIFVMPSQMVHYSPGACSTALRPPKTLHRHLIIFRVREELVTATVYVARDDSEAHWRIFLLVAAVALVVAIKHFVENGTLSEGSD